MTDAYLKSWLDRVENLENEQKGIGSDKRDLYTEAKSKGYNPKALRRIVAARKRKDEDEIESDVATYKAALGLAVEAVHSGVSLRKAAKAHGVSKSSVHRALAVPAASHDPNTGEITEQNAAPHLSVAEGVNLQPEPKSGEGSGTHSATEKAVSPGAASGTGEVTTPKPAAVATDDWDSVVEFGSKFQAAITARRSA